MSCLEVASQGEYLNIHMHYTAVLFLRCKTSHRFCLWAFPASTAKQIVYEVKLVVEQTYWFSKASSAITKKTWRVPWKKGVNRGRRKHWCCFLFSQVKSWLTGLCSVKWGKRILGELPLARLWCSLFVSREPEITVCPAVSFYISFSVQPAFVQKAPCVAPRC